MNHIDFAFEEGELVSIVGESGSGKTTLAKMLLGLLKTTEGEIYYKGELRDISTRKKEKKNTGKIFKQYSKIRFHHIMFFTKSTQCY